MSVIQRFEDIEGWKKARELTRRVFALTTDRGFGQWAFLREQLCSASVSIMSNIAEGFERDGNREFRQFLSNAKGSSGEVRSLLYPTRDAKLVSEPTFAELYALSEETGKTIGGFLRYLRASPYRGLKYGSDP